LGTENESGHYKLSLLFGILRVIACQRKPISRKVTKHLNLRLKKKVNVRLNLKLFWSKCLQNEIKFFSGSVAGGFAFRVGFDEKKILPWSLTNISCWEDTGKNAAHGKRQPDRPVVLLGIVGLYATPLAISVAPADSPQAALEGDEAQVAPGQRHGGHVSPPEKCRFASLHLCPTSDQGPARFFGARYQSGENIRKAHQIYIRQLGFFGIISISPGNPGSEVILKTILPQYVCV
jgi:hypothetical protein